MAASLCLIWLDSLKRNTGKSKNIFKKRELKVAGSAMMFLFAFADVVLAFWALRLKHRRGEK